MGKIWGGRYPTWALAVRDAIKDLDAADQVKGRARYDGRYQGIDLKALAALYVKRYSSHQVGIYNVFTAALGLDKYVKSISPTRSKKDLRLLSNALLFGAREVMKGRKPNFKGLYSFKRRFIPEEFSFYFNRKIVGRKQAQSAASWQVFWRRILANCRTDLFVSRYNCSF